MSTQKTVGETSSINLEGKKDFFPTPDDFANYVSVPLHEFQGTKKVLVSLDVLRSLVGLAAAGTTFEGEFYARQNPDVFEAHKRGDILDLEAHFINHGYFERRLGSKAQAYPVDEAWYVKEYPDVAAAISSGAVDSASHHYYSTGRSEGRLPSSNIKVEVKRLIVYLAAA